jgi:hypothetical protein
MRPRTQRRPEAGRRLFRRVAGVLAALLIAALTGEIALRLLRPHDDFLRAALHSRAEPVRFDHVQSVEALLAAAPYPPVPFDVWGGFKCNARGFRTHEYAREKPPGTYRVLALGDSFTFASGAVPFERMWHTLVGDQLRTRRGAPVEVINLGVNGVGPRFVLRLFELEGDALAPDLVLHGLFVGNDLLDEAPLERASSWTDTSLLVRFLSRARVLAQHAGDLTGEANRQRHAPPRQGPGGFPVGGYTYDPDTLFFGTSEEAYLRIERDRSDIFTLGARPRLAPLIAEVADVEAGLARAVAASGGRLVVVLMPDRLQVDPILRRTVLTDTSAYDFSWIQTALAAALAERQVAAVDLLPAFQAAPPTPALYRRGDTHWSAAGDALAAAEIGAFLVARGVP